MESYPYKISPELMKEVCSVILDTGFSGSSEEYVKVFYGKPIEELTTCEAEMLVNQLKDKPGCLHGGKDD